MEDLDIAGTIQGEGILTGVPSLFIRLSGCNLKCIFQANGFVEPCDTPHTSWFPESIKYEVSDIVKIVRHNIGNMRHVVITGGEPLLQMKPLIELCDILRHMLGLHVTIETNGTLYDSKLSMMVDLYSISPKLSNSNPTQEKINKLNDNKFSVKKQHDIRRYNIKALQSYIDIVDEYDGEIDIQFKFVVSTENDIKEIKEQYINKLQRLDNSTIMLMPVGMTTEHLKKSQQLVISECIKNNWRFTNRLHIELFGNKLGV